MGLKAGYVRTSRDQQDPAGQVQLLIKSGVSPDLIFVDSGASSMQPPKQRPGYQELLGEIERNYDFPEKNQIKEIVVTEFSRLGRDTETTIREIFWLNDRGIKITPLSATDAAIVTCPPAMRTLMLAVVHFAVDMERQHLRERTRYGISKAREAGKKIGRPVVEIDFDKIHDYMTKYRMKEAVAVRLCGYKPGTYYKRKREVKQGDNFSEDRTAVRGGVPSRGGTRGNDSRGAAPGGG